MRWWWIPVALLVLLGVLSIGRGDETVVEPKAAPVEPVAEFPDDVIARDASGRRERVLFGSEQALVVALPEGLAGERVAMKMWRLVDGVRPAKPSAELRPRVRADGTVPMLGFAHGDYAVEIATPDGGLLRAENVAVPGRYAFGTAMPPR